MEGPHTKVLSLSFQRRIIMRVMVYLHIKSGRIMVPSISKTEAGFYLDCDPVEMAEVDNALSISLAVRRTLDRGCTQVPTPGRDEFQKWVLLKNTNSKTPRELHRQCLIWSFDEDSNKGFRIEGFKNLPNGKGAEPDPAVVTVLPPGTSFEHAIEKLLGMIKTHPED